MFILIFGIILSASFCSIQFSKKNRILLSAFFLLNGSLQMILYLIYSERIIWYVYPLITHLPLALLFCFYYRKRIFTVISAICTAYLCCQPSKWVGLFMESLGCGKIFSQFFRLIILLLVGYQIYATLLLYILPKPIDLVEF